MKQKVNDTKMSLNGQYVILKDESFKALSCTDTDNKKNKGTEWHMHLKHKINTKNALAKTNIKLQNPGLVIFHDIQPRNWVNRFL